MYLFDVIDREYKVKFQVKRGNNYTLTVKDAQITTTSGGGEFKLRRTNANIDIHFSLLNEDTWCIDIFFDGNNDFKLNSINGLRKPFIRGGESLQINCEKASSKNRRRCSVTGDKQFLPNRGDLVLKLTQAKCKSIFHNNFKPCT